MDVALYERSAVLNKSSERLSYRFTLFMVYLLLLANAFLAPIAVTIIALTYIISNLFLSGFRLPKDIRRYIVIPVVLIGIGFLGSFDKDMYDAVKDAWYFINPAIVLLTGYLVMKRVGEMDRLLRVLVIAGFILAFYHVADIAYDPRLLFDDSATIGAYRKESGAGYLLSCLSLIILLFSNRYALKLFTSRHKKFIISAMIFVTSVSLFLSFSRTLWGVLIILAFVMLGQFTLRRGRIFIFVVLIVTALMTLPLIHPGGRVSHNTMLDKIADSVDEMVLRDYTSRNDINLHWRGYESYWAMQTYLDGGWTNLVAGHGLGKLIDLKITILLGDNDFRFVPILHNGFMYVLVKTGALGVALYLMYLYIFYKDGSAIALSKELKDIFVGRMIIALTLVMGFSTLVFMGYFHKITMLSAMFLLGILLCYARARKIAQD